MQFIENVRILLFFFALGYYAFEVRKELKQHFVNYGISCSGLSFKCHRVKYDIDTQLDKS